MVLGNGEMHAHHAILVGGVLGAFGQMLLERGARVTYYLVELQQRLGQLAIVQALLLDQGAGNVLIAFFVNEGQRALAVQTHAGAVQHGEESELADVVEECLHEVVLRQLAVVVDESEHVLEHTRGGAAGRHHLEHRSAAGAILVPYLDAAGRCLLREHGDAVARRGRCLYIEPGKALGDHVQLLLKLPGCDTLLFEQFDVYVLEFHCIIVLLIIFF